MTVLLESYAIPEKGRVELKVERAFDIKITAEEVRRQVNRWLLNEVSYLISADPPTLVVGEQVVWRVPAWVGFSHTGRLGVVGAVEVDVETGEMVDLAARQHEIEQNLERLKPALPPYQRRPFEPAATGQKTFASAATG
jgi:hypothetical protein